MIVVENLLFIKVFGTRLFCWEDLVLFMGEVKYIDDLNLLGALYLVVLCSFYAHVRIIGVDLLVALVMFGVVVAYSGVDIVGIILGAMLFFWLVIFEMKVFAHYAIVCDKARYVGDGVAVVLAWSSSAARDAIEIIDVIYDVLFVVVDLEIAAIDAVLVYDEIGINKCYTWELKVGEEVVEEVICIALYVVKKRYV